MTIKPQNRGELKNKDTKMILNKHVWDVNIDKKIQFRQNQTEISVI